MPEDPTVIIVTMQFDAADEVALLAVLAKYVVLARGHDGCRNIDLCASATTEHRYVVISKWASGDAQRTHFDSPEMIEMAAACAGRLTRAPAIELLEGVSAHDLA